MPELLEPELQNGRRIAVGLSPDRPAVDRPPVVHRDPSADPDPHNETFHRDSYYRWLLMLADMLAVVTAVAVVATFGIATHLTLQASLAVLFTAIVAKVIGLYDRDDARLNKSTLDEVPALLQLATLVAFIAWGMSSVLFDHVLTPRDAGVFAVMLLGGLVSGRALARRIAGMLTRPERCLFIGSTDEARRFQDKLRHDRGANAKLVAHVELDDMWPWAASLGPDHAVGHARRIVRELKAQRVIIAPHNPVGSDVVNLMRMFESAGVRVSVIPALLQVVGSAVEFDDVQGVAVLGVRSFRLSRSSRLAKRTFDLVGGAIALALAAPVMIAIAVAVKVDSRGPILFRQERVGRRGRRFKVLKFRSMIADAEQRKRELVEHNQAADGFFKIHGDPRITRVGRFLRKSNLDELPQLLNVLRGEMSLVGPRPLIPEEDARVVGWHRRRLELTPGITGHWQVLGSSRVPLGEMVAIDYLYAGNWSLWADLKLLLRTVPHVMGGRGV